MALAFPAGPTGGQQYTGPNGIVYQWDSAVGVWIKVNAVQTMTSGATAGTGAARIPTGNTAARPAATLAAGQFRYNSQLLQLEYSDGTSWLAAGGLSAANLAQAQVGNLATVAATPETAVPKNAAGMTGSAFIPAGDTSQRPAAATYTGQFRYNTQIPQLEYSNGTSWLAAGSSISAASLAEAATGTDNTKYSSPQTAVPKDASGMTGAALVPGGTTLQRPGTPVTGMLRYNSTTLPASIEFWDSAAWSAVGGAGVAGLGINISVTGSIVKVSIPTVSTPPVAGALAAQAIDGSLYWDSTLGALFIRYNDGTTTQWVQAAASASGGGTAVSAASLAEAAAGTINTKYSSPQTAVPKDASGMTGAAILPSGTNAQRTAIAAAVAGMQRYNTDSGYEEVYTGATLGWRNLAYDPGPSTSYPDLVISANGPLPTSGTYKNITINAGVTATVTGVAKLTATGNISILGNISGSGGGIGGTTTAGGDTGFIDMYGKGGNGLGGGQINTLTNPATPLSGPIYGFQSFFGSSGGSGRVAWNSSGASGTQGGSAGASVVLIANGTLTQGAASTIDMSGGDSPPVTIYTAAGASSGVGGGGGGSGGAIVLQASTVSVSGTLNVSGGNGSNAVARFKGGGGGGGGYIVLNSSNTLTDSSTKNLSGGSPGADANTTTGGGIGGSFGGLGGSDGTAGATGQTLLNNFI